MEPPSDKVYLRYEQGTIVLTNYGSWNPADDLEFCQYDRRTRCYRLPAFRYPDLVLHMIREKIPYEDEARRYDEQSFELALHRKPRVYQKESVDKWIKLRQGVVVLPTGAGKSFVAIMAIDKVQRDSLVIVPTLDLMHQWYSTLEAYFSIEPGLIGGGYFEVEPLTISTYDSAAIHLERIGNQFGLIIFDECHHLPGETYALAAQFALAPYRLGLTATPERADGKEYLLDELIGPCVYRKGIKELAGFTLSEYDTEVINVPLTEKEQEEYRHHRQIYLDFVRTNGINFGNPGAWSKFIIMTSRDAQARQAFKSYLAQKKIAQGSEAKLEVLGRLMGQHATDRVIVFTADNATVYKISSQYLVPAITHQTKIKERKEILEKFNQGEYNCIVTSKVLNEGVDIPEANVGIVLSGSGSVREHVQRLGRILRKQEDKFAILYEVITENTSEEYVSQRRQKHEAYQD